MQYSHSSAAQLGSKKEYDTITTFTYYPNYCQVRQPLVYNIFVMKPLSKISKHSYRGGKNPSVTENSSLESCQHPSKFGLGQLPHLPQGAIIYIFMRDILTEAVCILEDCTFYEWALAFCWLHRSCDEPFCYHFSCGTHIWCTGTLENISEKSGKTGPC